MEFPEKVVENLVNVLASTETNDTVNYCVLINKLSELMGNELIQLETTTTKRIYGGRTTSPVRLYQDDK